MNAFTEWKKRKWFARIGIGMLSVIVFFVLLAGVLSVNWKTIGSSLPFGLLLAVFFWRERKERGAEK